MKLTRFLLPLLLTVASFGHSLADTPRSTPLDQYVGEPDPSYAWEVVSESTAEGVTTIVVDLVSQQWLTTREVDRPEWRHWLVLAIPAEIRSDIGMLYVGGGSNGRAAPVAASSQMAAVARETGSVAAELRMVPSQPLVFHGDGVKRTEDDLIGYTWDQYLKGGDARWLARNPMVKSVVRAMDAVTAVMNSRGTSQVNRFVVAGGSKRGWTTWLTGAVDSRVVGLVPIVIDVLNADESMRHHFAAYGFWAVSVGNYVDHGIMSRLDDPRLAALYALVDPYNYRQRLTMPKLILNAAGDQFFLPDSSQFYFHELRGENYLRYVPNADHGMDGTDAADSLIAFHGLVVAGRKPPQVSWHRDGNRLRVFTRETPVAVKLWQAHNPKARDFRVETLGRKYTSTDLSPGAPGQYEVSLPTPLSGWTASFVEMTFDVGPGAPLKLTTDISVTPDTLPFEGKRADQPTSVTGVCTGLEHPKRVAKRVVAALKGNKLAKGRIRRHIDGADLYVNWTPRQGLYAGGDTVVKAFGGRVRPVGLAT